MMESNMMSRYISEFHELEKIKKVLDVEKSNIRAALEEAEVTLLLTTSIPQPPSYNLLYIYQCCC
jgi:hypothetical protein